MSSSNVADKQIIEYSLTITERIKNEDIDDIISCALEGGINYWASAAYPVGADISNPEQFASSFPAGAEFTSECLTRGVDIVIEEQIYENTVDMHVLTMNKFRLGLQMTLEQRCMLYEDFIESYDASDADVVIQNALFGDVIYG